MPFPQVHDRGPPQSFKKLFPDTNLTPKHHFMVHYPDVMIQVGPIVNRVNGLMETDEVFTVKRVSGKGME